MDPEDLDRAKKDLETALTLAKELRYEEAAGLLEGCIDRHPEFLPALMLLGEVYLTANQPEYAVEPLEAAKRVDPEFAPARLLLGNAYARTFRLALAIAELQEADRLHPGDGEVQRQLGWTHCVSGRVEEGRKYLRRAMALDPTNALAYNDMAASFMFTDDRDLQAAEEWLTRARELDPEDEFIRQTYQALVEMRQRQPE